MATDSVGGRLVNKKESEGGASLSLIFILDNMPDISFINHCFNTFARFAVPNESHSTGTKIRSFIVLTVGIDVTRGWNGITLVDIYE